MKKTRSQFLKITAIVLIFYFFYYFLNARSTKLEKKKLEWVTDINTKEHQNIQVKF